VIRSKKQQDIQSVCDLHTPLTDEEHLTLLALYGLGTGPLLPDPIKRQPYDELYVKLKTQRDSW
jgi:hypothetical protein